MPEKTNPSKSSSVVNLAIDTEIVTKILTGFIKDCFDKTKSKKAVIGLSGGLDSSIVASLAVRGLGAQNVLGVILPYKLSAKESKADAEAVAHLFGIKIEVIEVTPMVDAFLDYFPDISSERIANVIARQRMIVLYDISAREKGLVLGTSNKSELMLGYGTIFGDLASAVNPVGDLYKTQMRQLAEYLEIPDTIRSKSPTADLIEGQTDESDFGFTYDEADRLLYLWVDKRCSESELEGFGFEIDFIKDVIKRVRRNHFKRVPPLIGKISARTIGHEFRYPWDWSTTN